MRAAVLILLCCATALGQDSVPEPDTYRQDQYLAPVPRTLKGGEVIGTDAAAALWKAKSALFIDVLPRAPKPANLPAGTIWRDKKRLNIPGSVWLPDTGYGALSAETEAYFQESLDDLTNGDLTRAIVFYCLRDCWMSWNAAKRALALGYTKVVYFPDGADGWSEAGLPLENSEPRLRSK